MENKSGAVQKKFDQPIKRYCQMLDRSQRS